MEFLHSIFSSAGFFWPEDEPVFQVAVVLTMAAGGCLLRAAFGRRGTALGALVVALVYLALLAVLRYVPVQSYGFDIIMMCLCDLVLAIFVSLVLGLVLVALGGFLRRHVRK